jgi:hypothetical protein
MLIQEAAGPARSLFHVDGAGWLRYAPLRIGAGHRLPTIVYANTDLGDEDTDAVFVMRGKRQHSARTAMSAEEAAAKPRRRDDEDVMFRRRLYKLDWAGRHHRGDDSLPCSVLQHWGGSVGAAAKLLQDSSRWGDAMADRPASVVEMRMPMVDVLRMRQSDGLLHELPEMVAYHCAVALDRQDVPVCNLPGPLAYSVVHAQFAMDADYHAAATYLKWLAETHWGHPLLEPFDSNIREQLLNISIEATRLFFHVVGDTMYDPATKFYARGPLSEWWSRLACYLFWIGRTGAGHYARHADWPEEGSYSWKDFAKAFPEVIERRKHRDAEVRSREKKLSRADGRDPAVMFFSGENASVSASAFLVVMLPLLDKLLRDKLGAHADDGMTVEQLLDVLYPAKGAPTGHQDLRDSIEQTTGCDLGGRPSARKLGKYFSKHRGRMVQGRMLQSRIGSDGGPPSWCVRTAALSE